MALEALDVEVRLWKTDHSPRYEIRASIPLEDPIVTVTRTARGTAGSSRRCAGRRDRSR
jgi:hypothetical protein